jgi:hypothetical protein
MYDCFTNNLFSSIPPLFFFNWNNNRIFCMAPGVIIDINFNE